MPGSLEPVSKDSEAGMTTDSFLQKISKWMFATKDHARPIIWQPSQDELVFNKVVIKLIQGSIEKEGANVSRVYDSFFYITKYLILRCHYK